MSNSNYPKRFEILQNDGKSLKFRVNELTKWVNECFVKHFINDKDQGEARKTTVTETLEYVIEESGKHTFSFFKYDPAKEFDALENGINTNEDNSPIWEQDVFVIKHDPNGLTKEAIDKLARKYAPFVLMDGKEECLPGSIAYLQNWNDETKETIDECNVNVTLKIPGVKNIDFPYHKLAEVLPYNGHKDAILDTIGLSFKKYNERKTIRDALKDRKGDRDNITIYYSYIPNPEEKQQIIINYHFLYAYDPKMEADDDKKKFSHVFDRESISVVFHLDMTQSISISDNPEITGISLNPRPEFIVYGAHVKGQTINLIDDNNFPESKEGMAKFMPKNQDKLQEWTAPRIKVNWKDVKKIENHPTVSIARGSHAIYPIPGWYYVKQTNLLEPAMGEKAIVPSEALVNKMQEEFREIFTYELKDLELGSITSSSWNRMLAFSGYLVDIIILKGAKFPPFTERETKINEYVNGDITVWDGAKISEKSKQRLNRLMNNS